MKTNETPPSGWVSLVMIYESHRVTAGNLQGALKNMNSITARKLLIDSFLRKDGTLEAGNWQIKDMSALSVVKLTCSIYQAVTRSFSISFYMYYSLYRLSVSIHPSPQRRNL